MVDLEHAIHKPTPYDFDADRPFDRVCAHKHLGRGECGTALWVYKACTTPLITAFLIDLLQVYDLDFQGWIRSNRDQLQGIRVTDPDPEFRDWDVAEMAELPGNAFIYERCGDKTDGKAIELGTAGEFRKRTK